MDSLSSKFCFPRPPFRIDKSALAAPPPNQVLSGYLEQICRWRSVVLEFLQVSEAAVLPPIKGLSERARLALQKFLTSNWSEQMSQYAAQCPYNIRPFPGTAVESASTATLGSVLEVLQWRAGFEDYLCDVCFAIDPSLDLDECCAIGEFLSPIGKQPLCFFCLTEFAPANQAPDQHRCLVLGYVRAKWPPMPPKIEAWQAEASRQSALNKL